MRAFRRRRYVRARRSLGSQNKVYSFKRSVALAPWANIDDAPVQQASTFITNHAAVGNYQFGYFKFRLADLPNFTDFTNLYERYKIVGVKLRFIPVKGDNSELNSTGGAYMSPLAVAINRSAIQLTADDRTFNELVETQDCRVYDSRKGFNMYIPYPKFYAPADGFTTAQEKSGWIRSGEANIHHFGLQYAFQISSLSAANATAFSVIATYYIKAANPQ